MKRSFIYYIFDLPDVNPITKANICKEFMKELDMIFNKLNTVFLDRKKKI